MVNRRSKRILVAEVGDRKPRLASLPERGHRKELAGDPARLETREKARPELEAPGRANLGYIVSYRLLETETG